MVAGESLSSKRSSLDRHSELSAGIIRDGDDDSVNDEDRVSDDGNSSGNLDGMLDDRTRKRSKKVGRNALSLISSTFTRFVFYTDGSTMKDELEALENREEVRTIP